jgi:hypothetical protein
MTRNAIVPLTAALLTLAAPAHAYKIGSDVSQTTEVNNVVTSSIGSRTYARTDINTVYDGADIGGNIKQSLRADNIITNATGSRSTACTSINVLGQKDCAQR